MKSGRRNKLQDRESQAQITTESTRLNKALARAIEQPAHVIRRLGFAVRPFFREKDSSGRLPLGVFLQIIQETSSLHSTCSMLSYLLMMESNLLVASCHF